MPLSPAARRVARSWRRLERAAKDYNPEATHKLQSAALAYVRALEDWAASVDLADIDPREGA